MNAPAALYRGIVTHARTRPAAHSLRYRTFHVLLDLDRIDEAAASCRLFSRNRFNLLSFHDKDHGTGTGLDLKGEVLGHLDRAGIDLQGGPVRILTMPRVLGYVFNPLSVYFCHHADGTLKAVLYEVSNTFGQRHSYLLPVEPEQAEAGTVRQSVEKGFYVSPFLDMDMAYHFRVRPPEGTVKVDITCRDKAGVILHAALAAERHDFTNYSLLQACLSHPMMTLKVILGIHWEALLIWLKGNGLTRRPPAPAEAVTIRPGAGQGATREGL